MPDRKNPVGEHQLRVTMERIAALTPAYLSDYVVPRLPVWEAEVTLTYAVMAAARRATQGHADWPATDVGGLARALRDRAPEVYVVLKALLEQLEEAGPSA